MTKIHIMSAKKRFLLFAVCIGFAACSNQAGKAASSSVVSAKQPQTADTPLPTETSPPGDIPDTQTFVTYKTPDSRVTVIFPEGWQRTVQANGVTFVRDFNGERIRRGAPTAGSLAVRDVHESVVKVPGGPATLVAFTSNSTSNAVTGKRVRLQNNTYVFKSRHGDIVLDLWAPLGADNVDQWKHIAQSLRFH